MWLDVKERSVWTEEIHWPCRERIDWIYSIIYCRICNCLENLKHTHTHRKERESMISLRSFYFEVKTHSDFAQTLHRPSMNQINSNFIDMALFKQMQLTVLYNGQKPALNHKGHVPVRRSSNPAGLKTSSPLIDLHSSHSLPPFRSIRLSWRRGRDEVWHLSSVQSMITWSLWSH